MLSCRRIGLGQQEDRLEAELVPVNDHDVIVMSR